MKNLLFLFVCFMTLAFTSSVFGQVTIMGTLDATPNASTSQYTATTGTQTLRLFRDGVASTCAVPKPTSPGTFGAGQYRYDAYTFTAGSTGCVTVTLTVTGGPGNIHSVAYVGAFNPTNINTNYRADSGSSALAGTPVTYSFNVTAGQQFTIVVNENTVGGGVGTTYTLQVSGITIATAAGVTVSGRVLNSTGKALSRATVTATNSSGVVRTATTERGGDFTLLDMPSGESYVFEVRIKGYSFSPQVITITEDLEGLTFSAQ